MRMRQPSVRNGDSQYALRPTVADLAEALAEAIAELTEAEYAPSCICGGGKRTSFHPSRGKGSG